MDNYSLLFFPGKILIQNYPEKIRKLMYFDVFDPGDVFDDCVLMCFDVF